MTAIYLTEDIDRLFSKLEELEQQSSKKDNGNLSELFRLTANAKKSLTTPATEAELSVQVIELTHQLSESRDKISRLFRHMNSAFAYHRIITDDNGKAVDYEFLEVNPMFGSMIGKPEAEIIGRRVTEVIPGTENDPANWIGIYGEVARTGKPQKFESYSAELGKWFSVSAYSPEQGYFVTVFEDITDRMQVQKELKISEERFGLAMEATSDGLFDWNLVTNEIYYSPRWKSMLGYEDHELENSFSIWENLTESKDVEESWRALNEHIQGKRDRFEMEFRMKHKKGHWVDILSRAEAIFDEDGKAVRMVGTHVDITERKQYEKKLTESEERYRVLIENMGAGLGYYDLNGRVILFNKKAALTMAGEPGDFKGKTLIELYGEEFGRMYHDRILSVANERKAKEYEDSVKLPGGECWFLSSYSPVFGSDNKLTGVQIIANDITVQKNTENALKERELRLSKIFEILPVGLWFADKNGKLLKGNPEGIRIWGAEPQVGMDEYNVFKAWHVSTGEEVKAGDWALARTINEGVTVENELLKIRAFDGSEKMILNFTAPVMGDDGEILGAIVLNQDVTEIKIHERALRESELKFRALAETAPVAIMMFQDDSWIFVNPMASEMTGYSREELLNMNFWQLVHPDFTETVKERGRLRQDGKPGINRYEFKIVTKTGEEKWVHLSGTSTTFQGKSAGLISVIDITRRKHSEEELKKSEEKYRTIYENMMVGLFRSTPEGKVLEVNEAMAKIYGYDSAEELLNRPAQDYYTGESDRQAMLDQLTRKGRLRNYVTLEKKKDGSHIWVNIEYKAVYANDGSLKYLDGVVIDISEEKAAELALKVSEEKFRTYIESSPTSIFLADAAGQFTYVNNAAARLLGYTRDELLAMKIPDVLAEYEIEKGLQSFSQVKKQNAMKSHEIKFMHKNGHTVDILLDAIKLSDQEFMAFCRDISDLKRTQRELQVKNEEYQSLNEELERNNLELQKMNRQLAEAKIRAEESDRLKSAFLANMSHEIRTPMNGILGFADLLKDQGLSPERQEKYIGVIEKSGIRMLTLINDLIDISKIESGQMELSPGETDIAQVLQDQFVFFQPEYLAKNIQLKYFNHLPEKQQIVFTDQQKLEAVLINLIKNALKYTSKGSVEYGCEPNGTDLLFTVRDTGIGIPPNHTDRIFKRFVQTENILSRPYEGAGLGLAISKAFVEMMGGRIWVKSKEGQGSVFSFTIPRGGLEKDQNYITRKEHEDMQPLKLPKLNILIVEDTESSAMYLSEILREVAGEIVVAGDGNSAVKICREHPDIDLVLMDIKMPGMNGYQATRMIREFNREVIIIAQTAFAMPGDHTRALDAGCNNYLSKPIRKSRLFNLLAKYFENPVNDEG